MIVSRAIGTEDLARDDLGASWERAVDREERPGDAHPLPLAAHFRTNAVPLRVGPADLGVSIVHLSICLRSAQ